MCNIRPVKIFQIENADRTIKKVVMSETNENSMGVPNCPFCHCTLPNFILRSSKEFEKSLVSKAILISLACKGC